MAPPSRYWLWLGVRTLLWGPLMPSRKVGIVREKGPLGFKVIRSACSFSMLITKMLIHWQSGSKLQDVIEGVWKSDCNKWREIPELEAESVVFGTSLKLHPKPYGLDIEPEVMIFLWIFIIRFSMLKERYLVFKAERDAAKEFLSPLSVLLDDLADDTKIGGVRVS